MVSAGQMFLNSSGAWPHGASDLGIPLYEPKIHPLQQPRLPDQRESGDEIGDWETYHHDVGSRDACGEFVCPSDRRRVWWRPKAA